MCISSACQDATLGATNGGTVAAGRCWVQLESREHVPWLSKVPHYRVYSSATLLSMEWCLATIALGGSGDKTSHTIVTVVTPSKVDDKNFQIQPNPAYNYTPGANWLVGGTERAKKSWSLVLILAR